MKSFISLLPLALIAYAVSPEAYPDPAIIKPGYPIAGCAETYPTAFTVLNVNLPGTSRKRTPPQEGPASTLVLSLQDGILRDSIGRFGYIASNRQFQFDNPIQSEAIYTEGWTICPNNTLGLGGGTTFWQCSSGDFYNLYDESIYPSPTCIPIELEIFADPTGIVTIAGGGAGVAPTASTGAVSVAASSSSVAAVTTSSASIVVPPLSTAAPPSSSSSAVVSSSAPASSSSAAPSTTAAPTSKAAVTSASATSSYTGAAHPVLVDGSFFALLAGAIGAAMI